MILDHSWLRLVSLACGSYSIYLGHNLFVLGVTGQASLALKSSSIDAQLINGAPGIFFAISGVIIVLFSIFRMQTLTIKGELLSETDLKKYSDIEQRVQDKLAEIEKISVLQKKLLEEIEKLDGENNIVESHIKLINNISSTQKNIEQQINEVRQQVQRMRTERNQVNSLQQSKASEQDLNVPAYFRKRMMD